MSKLPFQSLYAAFDTFPAPKGAATHIYHMTQVLFSRFTHNALYVLGGEGLPATQIETHTFRERRSTLLTQRYQNQIPNYLYRAIDYTESLAHFLNRSDSALKIAHFRDPWSGYALLNFRHQCSRQFKVLFEVNGLPSIELPYAYPAIAPATLSKIQLQENFCLQHSDHIITPSLTNKNCLIQRGIPPGKITVVTNGADTDLKTKRTEAMPERYLLYFGALQQWQGIDDLFRIMTHLLDYDDLKLVLCVSKHNRFAKAYRKMAHKLDIEDRVIWRYGLSREELAPWIAQAQLSLAPLTDCPRNTRQGCCPLKILESMAAETPVVASNLPVVREIMQDKVHGRLCRPRRPLDFALAIRLLLDYPEQIKQMGCRAREHIRKCFHWPDKYKQLNDVYDQLMKTNRR